MKSAPFWAFGGGFDTWRASAAAAASTAATSTTLDQQFIELGIFALSQQWTAIACVATTTTTIATTTAAGLHTTTAAAARSADRKWQQHDAS